LGTYHHGDLRAALVATGIEMLERDGLPALSLRAVAREVGVSHAAPARHFADATSFLAAIAAAGHRELAVRLGAARGRTADAAFLAVGRAYVAFALAHREWYRVIFHPMLADAATDDPELREASEAAFAVLHARVERAMDAGVIARRDVTEVSLTLWSAVHGVCTLVIDRQFERKGLRGSDTALADTVLANLFLGLRPV
jgi:AcrR family transcriptional regulator